MQRWTDFAVNGYNGMGFTGYGNIHMNFIPLSPLIVDVPFTPPPNPGYALGLPPLAVTVPLAQMLRRVFASVQPQARVGRLLQLAHHVSQPILGVIYRVVTPLIAHVAMEIVRNFPF